VLRTDLEVGAASPGHRLTRCTLTIRGWRHEPQLLGGVADPEGERGTIERDAVGRQHLCLTIEWQMPMILGIDHMRDEPLGRQPTLDQSFRRGVLENAAMAGAARRAGG